MTYERGMAPLGAARDATSRRGVRIAAAGFGNTEGNEHQHSGSYN